MAYRFAEDTRETHPELMDRTFTEAETREVYGKIIDKGEYAEFEDWITDMQKSGLVTKEADGTGGWTAESAGNEREGSREDPVVEKGRAAKRQPARFCRPEPSPYPLGERGQYDFYVERLYPGNKAGSLLVGPVIYIGTGRDAQAFAGIVNGEPSDYRDSLLECADMRRSLGIRVMEGEDYRPDNLAATRMALEQWTQQKRFLVVAEMRELGYLYDESQSDSAINGRKVFRDANGHPDSGDISFASDEEALRWILDHPLAKNERIRALYEQLNPETLETELKERQELYHAAMQDTFRLDEPEPDRRSIFSPIPPQRQARVRR